MPVYLNTGQIYCYDVSGREIPCAGTGQDAEFASGRPWPAPRFEKQDETVQDLLTNLTWTSDANPAEFPLTWMEALDYVAQLNRDNHLGFTDWRLPNRRELRSLISYQQRTPALPSGYPFENVFIGWYWTGTSAAINPSYAWYVHFEGGRMFYGRKTQSYLVWPVRGEGRLPATGQDKCYDSEGLEIPCPGIGQDGEKRLGIAWPEPRFEVRDDVVLDRLTGLVWTRNASWDGKTFDWSGSLAAARELNTAKFGGLETWRLPTINELESLVDARTHNPALPKDHPFINVGQVYASSTTSAFEPDWVMLLHLHKGAVGVGQKKQASFLAWPVAGPIT
jgi:hypothetical protein